MTGSWDTRGSPELAPSIAGLHGEAELIPAPRQRARMFARYFLFIKYKFFFFFCKQQIILFSLSCRDCTLLLLSIALSNFLSVPGESVVLLPSKGLSRV